MDVRSWGVRLKEGQFIGVSRMALTSGSFGGGSFAAGSAANNFRGAAVGGRANLYAGRPSFRGVNGRHQRTHGPIEVLSLNIGTLMHSFTSWASAFTFDGGAGVGGACRETQRDIQMWATEVAPVPLTFCALCRGDGWVTQARNNDFPDPVRESQGASPTTDERIEAECTICGQAVFATTLHYEPPMSPTQFIRNVAIATPVRKHAIAVGFTFVPQAFLSEQFGSCQTRSSSGPMLGRVAAAKAQHQSAVASKLEQNSFFQNFCRMLAVEAARIYSSDCATSTASPTTDFSGTKDQQGNHFLQQTFFNGSAFARAVEWTARRLSGIGHSKKEGVHLALSRFDMLQFGSDLVGAGFLRSAAVSDDSSWRRQCLQIWQEIQFIWRLFGAVAGCEREDGFRSDVFTRPNFVRHAQHMGFLSTGLMTLIFTAASTRYGLAGTFSLTTTLRFWRTLIFPRYLRR